MKPTNHLIALDDAVQGQNSLGDFHDNGLYYPDPPAGADSKLQVKTEIIRG
jgi:hypothetical protein